MDIKGCGKRDVGLTFYLLRSATKSTQDKFDRIACGQLAETTGGSRGVLLCERCAGLHGFKMFAQEKAVSGRASS